MAFLSLQNPRHNSNCFIEAKLNTMNLQVQLNQEFLLDMGAVNEETDQYVLLPPDKSQFDQLVEFLQSHPQKSNSFNRWVLGIGATALCFRWGTYLDFIQS
jgi:hypothetical protein